MVRQINNLRKQPEFVRYFKNTSWLMGEQMLRMVAHLFVGIWVARYLGPEKFGILSYVLAFTAIFSSVAKLGLDGLVVRDIVIYPEKQNAYLGTAFWLKLFSAVATIGVIAITIQFINNDATTKFYIIIVSAGLIFQSFEVIEFYFQSQVLAKYISLCKIFQLLVSSILKIYFVLTETDLFWFVLTSCVDQIILALTLLFGFSTQKVGSFYFQFDRKVAIEFLNNAKPLVISGIFVSIYSNIDRIFIQELFGAREVGLYAVVSNITNAFYFIPMLLANSLFPAILNAKKQSLQSYNKMLSLVYKNIILFGLIICLTITYFAPEIIKLLFGTKYIEGSTSLKIYAWNFLLICFSAIFGKWILSENLQFLVPRFTFTALIINVIACYVFIPLWSIEGAAIAAIAAQLIPLLWFGFTNMNVRNQLMCVVKFSSI